METLSGFLRHPAAFSSAQEKLDLNSKCIQSLLRDHFQALEKGAHLLPPQNKGSHRLQQKKGKGPKQKFWMRISSSLK